MRQMRFIERSPAAVTVRVNYGYSLTLVSYIGLSAAWPPQSSGWAWRRDFDNNLP